MRGTVSLGPAGAPAFWVAGDIMSRPVTTIAADASALDAVRLMQARGVQHLVVVDPRGRVAGVVSDRDLRSAQPSALLGPDDDLRREALSVLRVAGVMSASPLTVKEHVPLVDVLTLMRRRKIGSVPVVDAGGRPAGIVTGFDVVTLALGLLGRGT